MVRSELLAATHGEPCVLAKTGRPKQPLYEEVAARIALLIETGAYSPGSRIPSVRQLSQRFHVSISTVMGAYHRLEDEGRIEARPQSGYYVLRAPPAVLRFPLKPDMPEMSRPASHPTPVTTRDLTMRVMRHNSSPALLPLGAAIPNPALLPLDKLDQAMTKATRRAGALGHVYDTSPGCEALRVQVARRLVGAGCTISPDQIVTTAGGQEAISLCLRALCRPGDTVAIESPIYYGILQAIEMQGLKALEIPTCPRNGMDLDALEWALDQHAISACVVIPSYNNPLGSLMPDEARRRLVEILAERRIPLIEDDVYGELGFGATRPKAVKAWDRTENVLLCSSFSKTLSPGYRVGWVAPGRWQAEVECQKVVGSLATPLPTQLAVAEFLRGGGYDRHLRRIRQVHAQQTERMAQAVAQYFPEGTRVTRPLGGYVLWVEMPAWADSLRLFHEALTSGISTAPGPMFSAQQRYGNFVRLNAAFWSVEIEEGVKKLGSLIRGQS